MKITPKEFYVHDVHYIIRSADEKDAMKNRQWDREKSTALKIMYIF